jgi:hypothetical protein
MQQVYDREGQDEGAGPVWVDFCAVALGAGAMLLVLHWLGVLTLIQRAAALI